MAKQVNHVVMVPAGCHEEVKKLISKYRSSLDPRPIKRKLRISKKEFARGQQIVSKHSKLGAQRDRWLDKLADEYARLEDLEGINLSKADEA